MHNLYLRTGYYKPTIEVTLNKLESFKDDQLVKLLSFLTDRANNMSSKDYANWMNRDFSFELEDVYVNISAYVRSDSPTCRKVQVGVTVQEVAEYELVCDWSAHWWSAADHQATPKPRPNSLGFLL